MVTDLWGAVQHALKTLLCEISRNEKRRCWCLSCRLAQETYTVFLGTESQLKLSPWAPHFRVHLSLRESPVEGCSILTSGGVTYRTVEFLTSCPVLSCPSTWAPCAEKQVCLPVCARSQPFYTSKLRVMCFWLPQKGLHLKPLTLPAEKHANFFQGLEISLKIQQFISFMHLEFSQGKADRKKKQVLLDLMYTW